MKNILIAMLLCVANSVNGAAILFSPPTPSNRQYYTEFQVTAPNNPDIYHLGHHVTYGYAANNLIVGDVATNKRYRIYNPELVGDTLVYDSFWIEKETYGELNIAPWLFLPLGCVLDYTQYNTADTIGINFENLTFQDENFLTMTYGQRYNVYTDLQGTHQTREFELVVNNVTMPTQSYNGSFVYSGHLPEPSSMLLVGIVILLACIIRV